MSTGTQLVFGSSDDADQRSDEEERLFLSALQLASASAVAAALRVAIELGVFEILADAGAGARLSPADVASRAVPLANANANADAPALLDRVMRLLACYSVLTCSSRDLPDGGGVERLYGVGAVGELFVDRDDGLGSVSLAPRFLHSSDKVFLENWYHLKDAILEGGVPFNRAHNGMTLFEYSATDLRFNKVFHRLMRNMSTITMSKVLKAYKGFQGLNSLVDVGGGTGACISMIVSNYPSIKAINFDLPHVVAHAPPHPGVEHVGGDMFVSIPKADAIFMKMVCHTWDDESCLRFLKNCYDALPKNGKVIIVEQIIPETPNMITSHEMKTVVHADLRMFAYLPNGKERSEKEFEALAMASGFQAFQVICSALEHHVMEFLKET